MKLKEMFKKNTKHVTISNSIPLVETEKHSTKNLKALADNHLTKSSSDYDTWLEEYKSRNPHGHNKITGLE